MRPDFVDGQGWAWKGTVRAGGEFMMGWHPLTWLWLALLDWSDVSNDGDGDSNPA